MCETSTSCEVCRSRAAHRCAGCTIVYYCSKEHQKQHWKIHKKICRPYKIEKDEMLGRHLIASRAIKAGEVIMKEKPLLRVPAQITGPVCLGCLESISEEDSKQCDRCGWPVCNAECQNSIEHRPECDFTIKFRGKVTIRDWYTPHPLYRLIGPIRVLSMLGVPNNKLSILESHCELRKQTRQWLEDEINVVQAMRRVFPDHPYKDQEILRACGILQINGHEAPLTHQPHVAIYAAAGSMFEHHCQANCTKTFTDLNGELTVWAAQDIPAETHLSICYTDPLWGTENRQHHLQESKLFQCNCQRCVDPTELGSYTSAVLCPNRKCNGLVLPIARVKINGTTTSDTPATENGECNKNFASLKSKDAITKSRVNWESSWTCHSCGSEVTYEEISRILDSVNEDFRMIERGSVDACKRFLSRHSLHLPLSHFAMLDIQIALAHLLGSGGVEQLYQLDPEDLRFKTELCEGLIEKLNKLAPGECRARGSLNFELHSTLAELARRSTKLQERQQYLISSLKAAKNCASLLAKEPQCLHEGLIRIQAEKNAFDLQKIISRF